MYVDNVIEASVEWLDWIVVVINIVAYYEAKLFWGKGLNIVMY